VDQPSRRVSPGSPSSLKEANQGRIVEVLRDSGTMTQAEIARVTGLAPSTVSNIVRELSTSGVLAVSPTVSNGRTAQAVRLTTDAGVIVGLDFGHRHLVVGIADPTCASIGEMRVALDEGHRFEESIDEASRILDVLLSEAGIDRSQVAGVGMGLPAPIDSRNGEVGAPSIMPGWIGVDAASVATKRLGLPVLVDNDANLGALAEARWGAGRGAENVAYLKLSDGVGAGLVIAGRVYRGRTGTAGEIGHATMNDYGAVCRCGNRGCLETLISTAAVLGLLEPNHGRNLAVVDVVRLAQNGDAACRRVLMDTGHFIGISVANLCNVFNPDRIVVGGELAQAGELLLESMRHTLSRYGIPAAVQTVEIVLAELGARSHIVGAFALAAQLHREQPPLRPVD
jgi:predicted NBD/HSP70 family sugar kinase